MPRSRYPTTDEPLVTAFEADHPGWRLRVCRDLHPGAVLVWLYPADTIRPEIWVRESYAGPDLVALLNAAAVDIRHATGPASPPPAVSRPSSRRWLRRLARAAG